MADELAKKENEDIRLEGNTAIWEMRMEGSISGTYVGAFKFRCYLTPLQQIAAGREQRSLLGEKMALAPDHESFLAYALSQLKQRVISAPPFWTSAGVNKSLDGDIPDEEVLEAVLDAAIRSEVIYKEALKKRKEEALARSNQMIKQMEEKQRAELEADETDEDKKVSDNT